jgi:hypothetical protein
MYIFIFYVLVLLSKSRGPSIASDCISIKNIPTTGQTGDLGLHWSRRREIKKKQKFEMGCSVKGLAKIYLCGL